MHSQTFLNNPPDNFAARGLSPHPATICDEWAILGGMRFLPAMIVVVYHCNGFLPTPHTGWTTIGVAFHGQAAVYGFLFISGYSMAHSLRNPKGFYLRRIRRIMPLYLAGLLLGVAVTAAGPVMMPVGGLPIESPSVWQFVGNALLLQGWVCQPIHCDGPVWSLAAEAIYYAIAPILKRARPWLLCLLICVSSISQICWPVNFATTRWGYTSVEMGWAWIGGFYWYNYRTGSTMILVLATASFFGPSHLGAVTIVSTVAVMIAGPRMAIFRLLRAPLLYLGELSYPLYLLHWPTILGLVGLRGVLDPVAWVIGSIGMSMIGYHAIDKLFRTSPLARAARLTLTRSEVGIAAQVSA